MVFWNCSKKRRSWYFGNAPRADRDGSFRTVTRADTGIYFGNAAGAYRDGIF
jgi:hypothetical protein